MDPTTRIIAATLAAACVQPQSTFDARTVVLAVQYFKAMLFELQVESQAIDHGPASAPSTP
jgi:hypothetical protein